MKAKLKQLLAALEDVLQQDPELSEYEKRMVIGRLNDIKLLLKYAKEKK